MPYGYLRWFRPLCVFAFLPALGEVGGFILATANQAVASEALDSPPRMIHKGPLHYPDSLLDDAVYGQVTLKFTVNPDATISNPTVLRASHPLFVAAALRALFLSKFAPALYHGMAVGADETETFSFEIDRDYFHRAHAAFNLPDRSPPATPAQFRYDHPPRVITVCEPVYPRDLFLTGVKGSADAVFILGPNGKVAAVKITSCTRPEFGAALLAAVETWRFSPAELNGSATMTMLSRHHDFTTSLRALPDGYSARKVLHELRTGEGVVESDTIDKPLRRVYEVAPKYPRQLDAERVSGSATVEFVVDHYGAVMFPKVVSATRPEFGWAAATAVQQWCYDPPTKGGKAADVRVDMSFEFKPETSSL